MALRLNEVNFFVYGTLKRGECRQYLWPREPRLIEEAWVYGELYDAGNYPALFPGTNKVLGELWSFPEKDFEELTQVLDEIEEYRFGDPSNLYNRERIDCETLSGYLTSAYTYIYARQQDLPALTRIVPPNNVPWAQWQSTRKLQ